jgi:acyl-CoA synthetase (AMP-forming)/AMP-acid ligase II
MVLEETDLLLPRVFGKTLMREKITHMTCSPSFLTFISEGIKNGAELFLKTIGIGGEDCSVKSAMLFMEKFPKARLINRYGPTETTVVVSSFEINQDSIRRCPKIPIGKPHKNIEFYVVDSSANVVEKGKEGELYISGIQLMQGYCGDERLTQKVMRNDVIKGITTYKTGDIVTIDHEGNYYYLDRVDNMVNRYGNRIYLSEIEQILQGMEIVDEVCCLADKTKDPVTINVFLCLNIEIPVNKLREEIIKILPKNMYPDKIIVLERMPINNKHKIDTESLMHKVKEMESS